MYDVISIYCIVLIDVFYLYRSLLYSGTPAMFYNEMTDDGSSLSSVLFDTYKH